MELIPLVVLFLIMYFVLLRPQQKRLKEQQNLVKSLSVGDDIVTSGGIYGTVTEVDRDIMFVEVAPGLELKIAREAVGSRVSEPQEVEEEAYDDDEMADDDVDESVED